MNTQIYWEEIGSKKEFEDPLYLNQLAKFIHSESIIVEYGCGYGRLMHCLESHGYHHLKGYDFAKSMIERGASTYPHLQLMYLSESGRIPLPDRSVDALILSTVLCSMVDQNEQQMLIVEIQRILKLGGVLYLSDFMISDHERYREKYLEGYKSYGDWGIYTTSEGLTVRHHTTLWILELLKGWNLLWFEQFEFKTMNQNPARTFHCIVQRVS